MRLSVVIPTYNQAPLLTHCLAALRRQTLGPGMYEIVVVDDGSTDDTPQVVQRCESGPVPVRSVRLSQNRGRSAARNVGVDDARGNLIVFVDSDVIVRDTFLESHLRAHDRYGSGILSRGPVVLVPDVASASSARVPRLAASPAYLDTANAGLERAALRRAGMFDEHFPGYGWEDVELGQRLRRIGIRRVFCPDAAAFHVQPPVKHDAIDDLLWKEEGRARSAAYFYRKVPTLETRWLIQATLVHRVVFWLLAAGGMLTPLTGSHLAQWLQRRRMSGLAYLVVRGALNRYYSSCLTREFRRDAALLA